MRIFCFSDCHVGGGYDEDVRNSLNQCIKLAKGNCDLIACPGDIYDKASSPADRELVIPILQEFATIAPVIIVRGNHDAPKDLKIIEHIKSDHSIFVRENFSRYTSPTHNVAIYCLPWFTKARWVAQHPEASTADANKTVAAMALEYLKGEVVLNGAGKKNILLGHLLINGAEAQKHQPLIGEGITFGQYDLRERGFYAGIFGHIHLKQTFDNGMFFYPGSVAPMSYGETPDKYCAILDTDADCVEFIRLNTVHRCTIDALSCGPSDFSMDVPDEVRGARVRVKLVVNEGDNAAAIIEQISARLEAAGAIEIKINAQSIPKSQLRAEEISKASTMAEKLKVYWASSGAPDEITQADMLDKLTELEDACI